MTQQQTKLDAGQKHILRLIVKDSNAEGWTTVSKMLYPVIEKSIPSELLEMNRLGDEGHGVARLTPKGREVVGAMLYL